MSEIINIVNSHETNRIEFIKDEISMTTGLKLNISGVNNTIVIKGRLSGHLLKINIKGNDNYIEIDDSCTISGIITAKGDSNIVKIGSYTTIVSTLIECEYGTKIELGSDCMLSRDVTIRSSDSHSIFDLNTGELLNESKDVMIGNHVWIGYGVKISKGSHVANNNVVGAGSLVNKIFKQENVVIAGSPGKVIRENVAWTRKHYNRSLSQNELSAFSGLFSKEGKCL